MAHSFFASELQQIFVLTRFMNDLVILIETNYNFIKCTGLVGIYNKKSALCATTFITNTIL